MSGRKRKRTVFKWLFLIMLATVLFACANPQVNSPEYHAKNFFKDLFTFQKN